MFLIYSSMFRELFMTEWHTSRQIVTQFFAHDYPQYDWLIGNYDIVNSLHIFVYYSLIFHLVVPVFSWIEVKHYILLKKLVQLNNSLWKREIFVVNKYLGHELWPIKIIVSKAIFASHRTLRLCEERSKQL